jgi:hypothetical protein
MQRLERVLLILTNLAVVAGLVLVFLELRQNRAAIELEYNMSVADIMSDTQMAVATDRSLAEALAMRAAGQVESLDAADQLRVRAWLSAVMEPRLSYYWMKDSDVIPQEDWCGVMRFVQRVNTNDFLRDELERHVPYTKRMISDVDARCGKYAGPAM